MNGLFNVKDSLANKISYYHLMLLMASLPFDRFYSHIVLISFGAHTLIQLKAGEIKPLLLWRSLALPSVFIITVLTTLYTRYPVEAFNEWGKQVTILIIALLVWLNPLDLKKYRSPLLLWFSFVCTATVIYLYANTFITIKHYGLPFSTIFSGAFTNHNFSEPIDMHATFFSMQVGLSLVYLLWVFIQTKSVYYRALYLVCGIILAAGILQLGSKSVCAALFIAITLAFPWLGLQGVLRRRFIAAASTISLLLVIAILISPTFKDRYLNQLQTDLSAKHHEGVFDSRLQRWKISVRLIEKEPLTGYGAGSEISLLQDGFFKARLYNSYLNRLNTHSQYLSFLLKSGAWGLLVYVLTLIFGFRAAIRQKDVIFFSFMLLIAVVSLSENLLDVDKGIFFYGLFFTFLTFSTGRELAIVKTDAKPLIIKPEAGQIADVASTVKC